MEVQESHYHKISLLERIMANGNTWTLVGALVGIAVISAAIIIALVRINKARSTATGSEKDQLNFSYGTLIAATVVLLIVAILIMITLFRRGRTVAKAVSAADLAKRASRFLS